MVNLVAKFMFTDKWHVESHTDRDYLHAHYEITALIIFLGEIRKSMKPKMNLNYIQEIMF
jgi:hypothetical protein